MTKWQVLVQFEHLPLVQSEGSHEVSTTTR